jgi:hypothetical protein
MTISFLKIVASRPARPRHPCDGPHANARYLCISANHGHTHKFTLKPLQPRKKIELGRTLRRPLRHASSGFAEVAGQAGQSLIIKEPQRQPRNHTDWMTRHPKEREVQGRAPRLDVFDSAPRE